MNTQKPQILISLLKATLFVLFFQFIFVYAFAGTVNNYLIENPLNLNHTEDNPFAFRAGDTVIVRPRILRNLNPLTDELIRYHYHLDPLRTAGMVSPGGNYWHYRITRTWVDFNMQADVVRHHNFRRFGIRPLRTSEVELEDLFKHGEDRIYDISDIALTQNIKSRYFDINDSVVFRKMDGIRESYKDAAIAGIFLNGDLAVRSGNTYNRIAAENVFSKVKNFSPETFHFKIGEDVFYRFERSSSDFITYEAAKILGLSPAGEVLILHKRLNSYVRISLKDIQPIENKSPKIISTTEYKKGSFREQTPHFINSKEKKISTVSCKNYFLS